MRARSLLISALIVGAPCEVVAQTATADGVVALARGDYQRAVEILKPLAEDWRTQDPAAAFFMAALYDSGRGVPADPMRACALYMRASSRPDTVIGREAMRLFAASISRGDEFNEECQLLANVGFDNGFEPVTFDLGPGHVVEWTLAAARLTYDGRTNRVPMRFTPPGGRFLPLRYTELATGPTRSARRHFIEVFVWLPSTRAGPPWNLQWHVFEVVGDRIIMIDAVSDPLAMADGDAPPARETVDVRDYAAVRVDDEGNAEWAVLTGPRPMTGRIESETERREIREESLAKDRARTAVDWDKRLDVRRVPTVRLTALVGSPVE